MYEKRKSENETHPVFRTNLRLAGFGIAVVHALDGIRNRRIPDCHTPDIHPVEQGGSPTAARLYRIADAVAAVGAHRDRGRRPAVRKKRKRRESMRGLSRASMVPVLGI